MPKTERIGWRSKVKVPLSSPGKVKVPGVNLEGIPPMFGRGVVAALITCSLKSFSAVNSLS